MMKKIIRIFIFVAIFFMALIPIKVSAEEVAPEETPLESTFEYDLNNVVSWLISLGVSASMAVAIVKSICLLLKKKEKIANTKLSLCESLLTNAKKEYEQSVAKANELIITQQNNIQALTQRIEEKTEKVVLLEDKVQKTNEKLDFCIEMLKVYMLNDKASIQDGVARRVTNLVGNYEKESSESKE